MMESQKSDNRKIINLSNEILNFLLAYKKEKPEFTFSLRSRDSPQSNEKRLENGQWFQGSNYIFVPLFKKGDSARKIKTIGFVITLAENGSIKENYLEISFKKGIFAKEEIEFHKELAKKLGVPLHKNNHGSMHYKNPDNYLNNLKDYLDNVRPQAIELLNKFKIKEKYLVSNEDFNRALERINRIKDKQEKVGEEERPTPLIQKKMSYPLNQILYGPPGTGKTYNTINKALEIIGENIDGKSRIDIKEIFDAKVREGQITFTTFHQSMSYEDFIEGIKPIEPKREGEPVVYRIVDGIFKRACLEPKLFSKGDKIGGYTVVSITPELITLSKPNGGQLPISIRMVQELVEFIDENKIEKFTGLIKNVDRSKYPLLEPYMINGYVNIIPILVDNIRQKKINGFRKVFIIDEINRGNVSQIFGELITLIEEDKRLGKDEALEVTLPYSKEKFGVPPNIFIIGTMNTADRSVEALDTALRRRFSFQEMPPDPSLIAKEGKLKETGGILNDIDLPFVLDTINKRIELLLDKDHQIGHSYFMAVSSLGELKIAFQNKIIPLLQEYFFGDYGKIGLVLGSGFLVAGEKQEENPFANFDDYDTFQFADKTIYKLKNIAEMSDDAFIESINFLLKK